MNEMSIAPLARQIRLRLNFCPRTCEHPQEQWPWAGLHQDFLILSTKSSPLYSFITLNDNILVPLSLHPPFSKWCYDHLLLTIDTDSSQTWRLAALHRRRTRRLLIPTKQSYRRSPKKLLAKPRCIVWNSTRENVAFISECAFIVHCAALRKQAPWSVCARKITKFKFYRFMLKCFFMCARRSILKVSLGNKKCNNFRSGHVAEPLRRCKNGEG